MSACTPLSRVSSGLRRSWAITRKDMRMYYFQPQSFMMGIIFPVALFLSFAVGRNVPAAVLVPGLMGIAVLFAASSIGPLAVPTERRVKTYDRMIVAPISPLAVIFGEICGGAVFGAVIAIVPLAVGMVLYGTGVANPILLLAGILLVAFEFSALGVMLAAIPTENPANVMIVANLIRLPLIFVSGIFISAAEMGTPGIVVALSPLTYAADAFRTAINGSGIYGIVADGLGVVAFTALFAGVAVLLHERNRKAS